MNDALLPIYLNDHLAGSVMAIEQFEHAIEHAPDGPLADVLTRLLAKVRDDQDTLKDLIGRIGGTENPVKKAGAWVAEKAQRLKPSGDPLAYTPLNRLEALEALLLGITGKRDLWDALDAACADDPRFRGVDFRALSRKAQRQHDALAPHRIAAARTAFVTAPDP